MPLYEYKCRSCGGIFDRIEKASPLSWKVLKEKAVYCVKCGEKTAFRIPSKFKIGTAILETTGKSGYETDDLTLGKIIDEGGIPSEHKRKLKERNEIIKRQKVYTKALNKRAKKYDFSPESDG